MTLSSPMWLWLLVPIAALTAWDARRKWRSAAARRWGRIALRTAMLVALIVAASGPRLHTETDARAVVFVVDRSASVSDAEFARSLARATDMRDSVPGGDRAGLVLFDDEPVVAAVPGEPWPDASDLARTRRVDGTNIDTAVRLAIGLIPPGSGGRIVLISDGRDTAGDMTAAAANARARGVAITAVATGAAADDPAVTAVVLDQPLVRPGASLSGHVEIDAGDTASRGALTVTVDGKVALRADVDVSAGDATKVPFEYPLDITHEPGTAVVEAAFTPAAGMPDREPGNNRAAAISLIGKPPRVRIVEGQVGVAAPLAKALRAEQMDVVTAKAGSEEAEADLEDVDLVVLANVPAETSGGSEVLSPEFAEQLKRWVNAGGGLIVLGGTNSYDLGGYGNSPIAAALPVELEPVTPEIESAASIVIILDQSGSMGVNVDGYKTKLDLANEGAAATVRLLRPFDFVGVMSVTETVHWQVDMQNVTDPDRLERKVLGIPVGGGGIFVYTSLIAAEKALAKVDTPLKHIILFSDADDSEEQVKGIPFGWGPGHNSFDVAKRMRKDGITLSVIGIGTEFDADTSFLRKLAKAGGGRFHLTNDARKLKSFFVEETEQLVDSSAKEKPFRPAVTRMHATVSGIDFASGPKLRGYNELEPRPTAEVIMTGPQDNPIMTTWQYGLGKVTAWASDAGPRWAKDWLAWDGYSAYWTQLARWSLRRHEGDDTAVEIAFDGTDAHVRVARRSREGLTIDTGGISARVITPAGPAPLDLSAPEPGLWQGRLPTEPATSYTVEIVDHDGELVASRTFVPPPSYELRHRRPDARALAALEADSQGSDASLTPGTTVRAWTLWPYFLLLALMLMPIDAFLRRPARVI